MNVKRPNQERFDMTQDELYAFWIIICAEYQHRDVREKSLLLYNNKRVRDEEGAG